VTLTEQPPAKRLFYVTARGHQTTPVLATSVEHAGAQADKEWGCGLDAIKVIRTCSDPDFIAQPPPQFQEFVYSGKLRGGNSSGPSPCQSNRVQLTTGIAVRGENPLEAGARPRIQGKHRVLGVKACCPHCHSWVGVRLVRGSFFLRKHSSVGVEQTEPGDEDGVDPTVLTVMDDGELALVREASLSAGATLLLHAAGVTAGQQLSTLIGGN